MKNHILIAGIATLMLASCAQKVKRNLLFPVLTRQNFKL